MHGHIWRSRGVYHLEFEPVMDGLTYGRGGTRLYRGHRGTEHNGQAVPQKFITPADALADALTRWIRKYRSLSEPLVSYVGGEVAARPAARTPVSQPRHLHIPLLLARVATYPDFVSLFHFRSAEY
jgi:hypothetical protein